MAKQTINVGIVANDRSGDPLRIAFTKINQNFTEVYNNIANTTAGGTDISDLTDTTGLLFSGNYEDLNNSPSIPTDISQLTDNLNVVGNILSETLGDITFSNTSIIGAQSPGSNGLIRLIPNNGNFQGSETGYTTFGQYVDINQYDAPHIHIAPGKGVGGTGDLVLGDDNFNIQINNQGYATVVTQDPVALAQKYWYFSQNGLLFGPAPDGQLYVHSLEGEQGKNLTIAVTDGLQQKVQIQFSNANGTANTTYTVNTNLWSLADIENSPFCNFYLSPGVSVSPSSITRNSPAEELVFTFAEPVTFNSGTAYYVYYSVSSAPNITLDAANNTWTFGADGRLIFSDNTIQTTAWAGGRVVNIPVSSIGAIGDKQGDLAFDGSYVYYCTQDFTESSYSSTIVSTYTGLYPSIVKGSIPQPQAGWSFVHNGTIYEIVSNAVENNPGEWTCELNTSISVTAGDTVAVGPVFAPNIWKRVAWSADTW